MPCYLPKIEQNSYRNVCRICRRNRSVCPTLEYWSGRNVTSGPRYEALDPRFQINFTGDDAVGRVVAQLVADSRDTSQGHKLVTLLAKGNARDGTCRKPRLGWTTCSTEGCTGRGFILKPHSSRSLDESVTEVQGDIIRPNASFILEEIRSRWKIKKAKTTFIFL